MPTFGPGISRTAFSLLIRALSSLCGAAPYSPFSRRSLALVIRRDWSWFVSSFCLLANGVYIAGAWVSGDRYLDTTEMLRHGAHPLSLAIYCLITIIGGYVGFRRAAIRILFANQVLSEAGQDTPFEDCSG